MFFFFLQNSFPFGFHHLSCSSVLHKLAIFIIAKYPAKNVNAVSYVITNTSKEHAASIFRLKDVSSRFL
jgi:hypothetical protein